MPLIEFLQSFKKQRVLVIGDVILDHYVRGSVSRTSPEAPVPILNVNDEEWLPGGAANVAMNIVSLGARVDLVGLIGNDDSGVIVRDLLRATDGMQPHLIVENERPTILKTRCVAQGQQMLRLDRETTRLPLPETFAAAREHVRELMKDCTGVILSDYGKGMLSPEFINSIVEMARERGLHVAVDPKGRDYRRYAGVTVVTPNQKEASDASGIVIEDDPSAKAAAGKLQEMVGGEAIVITRGAGGVSVFPRDNTLTHIPARAREVYDVTGAGDTFIAVFGLGLFSGAKYFEAAELGNAAAGVVVGHVGVAAVTMEEVRSAVHDGDKSRRSKLRSPTELEQLCRSQRHNGSRIVLTTVLSESLSGKDIRFLESVRGMGDCLIAAVPGDNATERIELLSALTAVDFVTTYDTKGPGGLIKKLRPEVYAVGDREPSAAEAAAVEEYEGRIAQLEL